MNFCRLKALIKKESLQVLRDPSTILIAFILPLILLFLMGYAVSLDARNIKLGLIQQSQSAYSKSLKSAFLGSKYFIVEEGKSVEAFKDKLQSGDISALLVIDSEFGKNGVYKTQLLIDAVEPNLAGFIQRYTSGVITVWAKQQGIIAANEIKSESRYWFNAPISSRYFLVPGSIVVIMTMIGTLLTALVIAREWERGTMEAMMATPATMVEILIGKLLPYFMLGMGSLVLCFIIAYFWYEIPFQGSLLILFAMGALYLFPSLSIGLFISSATKNQYLSAQIALVLSFLPAFLLSGFLFEIENMPQIMQYLTVVVPARYFVESIQTLFLAGNVIEVFLRSAAAIFFLGLFCFLAVLFKSKKGIE